MIAIKVGSIVVMFSVVVAGKTIAFGAAELARAARRRTSPAHTGDPR
ncbi:MAG: hypothetical protein JWO67_6234 [Streptosporangiaceae bacterium]|nr:hypothetical protein [Streptosporangiaceae bacterium]